MLVGHDVDVVAILDGDEPGRKEGKRLVQKLLSGDDRRCLFVGDYTTSKDGELEDLFPEDFYLKAVKTAYPSVELKLSTQEKGLSGTINKVDALFARKGISFEKWKAAAVLRDDTLAAPSSVPPETLDAAEQIFITVNALFP